MSRFLALYRDAFSGLSREVWLLSFFMFINRCGTMVLAFLVLYLTEKHGYGEAQAGRVLALYGVGAVVGVAVGGMLVDRVGFHIVQLGSLLLSGLGFIAFGFASPGPPLSLAAVGLGFLAESFRPANGAAIAVYSKPSNRARAYGLNRLAVNLGWTVGPLLGGFLAETDFSLLFWVDGVTCLACAAGFALFLPRTEPPPQEEAETEVVGTSPWRDRVFLAVFGLFLLQGLVFFQLHSTYTLHLDQVCGFSKRLIGGIFAINTVLIVLVEMPLVKSLEGRDPLRLIGLASLIACVGFGLLPLSNSLAWVVTLVLVWTLGEMLMAPMSTTWVANRANAANRGAYMAAFSISFSLCSALAPVIGTEVYERAGPTVFWMGCLALGVVVFAGFRILASRLANA